MKISGLVLSAALVACSTAAFADTVTYATVGATGSGTIGTLSYTYTGSDDTVFASNSGHNEEFIPSSTYTSATVSNSPTDGAIIRLTGGTQTLTFGSPVSGLIFDVFSLGGSGTVSTYTFDQAFTVLNGGPNNPYGGEAFTASGETITGNEANGVIEFAGPISELTFTVGNGENYSGFDIGTVPVAATSATPEPGSLVLLGTGMLGLAGAVRRRFKR